jgi:ribosomal protein S25
MVHPIARLKWIVHLSQSGEFIRRRKSPKKGKVTDLFYELVHTPSLIKNKNFSLEVLLIEEEEIRCNDGRGSWRRRGVRVKDRKLVNVFDRVVFETTQDFLEFLPKELDIYFTNKVLASKLGISIRLAQKITYCLKKMGVITLAGKKHNEFLFQVSKN